MTTRKPNEKNTKAEIIQAYEELAKEKAVLKSQIDQLAKESVTDKNQKKIETNPINLPINIQQKMNFTIDSLVKIQLGFGSAASELSEKLTSQASKLMELRQAVEQEIQQLKQLHNLEIEEETLDNLIITYENTSKNYQQEFSQRLEQLSQETQQQINTWQKEQEEHKKAIKERNENLQKNRMREEADYKYDLELQRNLAKDEYEQQQKSLYKELEEFRQEIEKQWAEREKVISEREKQFEEFKAKVDAFPQEKEAAIKKATEEGKGIAYYQAKVKADLYAKDIEGQKRYYEQRLQSLQQTITNQEVRTQNLSKQLESALKQVQDLAVKAIEGNASANSYQIMKEIALEQAKNQVKNK